jgi:hypothetical protein
MYTHITAPSGTPEWLTVRCSLLTSSVWLSWGTVPRNQQNGEITSYSIQVEGPDSTRIIPTTEIYTTFKAVSDLRPSTEYFFSVSAMTIAGSGPAISVSFVTPQEGEASIHNNITLMPLITISMSSTYMYSLVVWCGAYSIINLRRVHRRVTVVVLCVCLSVTTLIATPCL